MAASTGSLRKSAAAAERQHARTRLLVIRTRLLALLAAALDHALRLLLNAAPASMSAG
ncbi:hypothetical protein OG604_03095 [Streptomyces sp. NBC_01231]|nr:hypothetical protein OG604_03095 [Streptomyces sp. NBC_01231]